MRVIRCTNEGCKLKMAEKSLVPTQADYLLPMHGQSRIIKKKKTQKWKAPSRKNKERKKRRKTVSKKKVVGRKRGRRARQKKL